MDHGRLRQTVPAVLAALVVLLPVGLFWKASLVPGTYSVMDMGYADYGGGPHAASIAGGHQNMPAMPHGQVHGQSVAALTGPARGRAQVSVTLVARKGRFRLASGQPVDGYTLNGRSPGPQIRAVQGQLVQVKLVNESVPDGITLHWHGLDVPNAEDGVAGVTQDAVPPGGSYTYRFVAKQAGTFWYHSHQVSHEQVQRGLLGPLVITRGPARQDADAGGASGAAKGDAHATVAAGRSGAATMDLVALTHLYGGLRTVNGRSGITTIEAPPGSSARVRVINTDNGPMSAWVTGAPYRLVAVDGTDVNGPTLVRDAAVSVTAGGRADLEVTVPADGSAARVVLGGNATLVLGPAGASTAPVVTGPRPSRTLDLLTYGSPRPLGFDPASADRHFEYSIGRSPGFSRGVPGLWWTINGHRFPDVPMYVVARGDVVRMRVVNRSGDVHPMHLHGHHAVVLRRNGVPSTGSPWWVDSLNVGNGETYEIGFVADNPGIWMDHCHNLPHASQGLVAHLMYEGVTEPFRVGGDADNRSE
jgi:FtsP/CotA-like multicopper oxidase with cupredoxin domain